MRGEQIILTLFLNLLMMRILTCLLIIIATLQVSCKKNDNTNPITPPIPFVNYTIPKGAHYATGYDSTHFEIIQANHLHFTAIFDSSAIYTTAIGNNQIDVNKLYGFSDNQASHHVFSARIGWSWNNDSLRLFGYTYNDSVRTIKPLAIVSIGRLIDCNIGIDTLHKQYLFTINGQTTPMPRTAKTPRIVGYKLYPYFGGDEMAPHTVTIKVREEL